MAMSDAPLEFVDILRTLKKAINKGGKLYSAPHRSPDLPHRLRRCSPSAGVSCAADVGDHKGCYEAYLAAGREICARTGDDQIRSILEKAIADVEVQDNPTEQVRSVLGHGGARARARAREELDRVVEHAAGYTLPTRGARRWGRGSVGGWWLAGSPCGNDRSAGVGPARRF